MTTVRPDNSNPAPGSEVKPRFSVGPDSNGLCIIRCPEACADDWLNQPVVLTMADGSKVRCPPGSRMPGGMAISKPVVLLPETFIPSVCEPIHVSTRLSCLVRIWKNFEDDGEVSALYLAVSARRSVDEKIVRNDDILARMSGGCETSEREWQEFCNDCVILAAYKIFRGESVSVVPGTMDEAMTTYSRGLPSQGSKVKAGMHKHGEDAAPEKIAHKLLKIDKRTLADVNP